MTPLRFLAFTASALTQLAFWALAILFFVEIAR